MFVRFLVSALFIPEPYCFTWLCPTFFVFQYPSGWSATVCLVSVVGCAGTSGPGWGFVAAFCVVGGSLAVVDGSLAVGIAIVVIMGSVPSFPTSL